jgi:hypothetical protein
MRRMHVTDLLSVVLVTLTVVNATDYTGDPNYRLCARACDKISDKQCVVSECAAPVRSHICCLGYGVHHMHENV